MGRPKKLNPRNRQLNLSFTEAELAAICRRAHAVGMRPVHFGRAVLLDPKHPISAREDNFSRLVYGQLIRIGNNLNQAVRKLHLLGLPLPADLEPLLADVREMIDRMPR